MARVGLLFNSEMARKHMSPLYFMLLLLLFYFIFAWQASAGQTVHFFAHSLLQSTHKATQKYDSHDLTWINLIRQLQFKSAGPLIN